MFTGNGDTKACTVLHRLQKGQGVRLSGTSGTLYVAFEGVTSRVVFWGKRRNALGSSYATPTTLKVTQLLEGNGQASAFVVILREIKRRSELHPYQDESSLRKWAFFK